MFMKRTMRLAMVCSFFLAVAGDAHASQIKVIVTNDVHGHVMRDRQRGQIGYALLKGYINALTDAGWRVFLLDSGDAFSGSANAQVDHGRSIAELMGMMGYRVLTPGNHAFDHNEVEKDFLYYSRVLIPTVKRHSSGSVAVVADNLSLNGGVMPEVQKEPIVLVDDTTDNPDGLRLVVAGVANPYTARPSLRDSVPGYGFGFSSDPAETKQAILTSLEASLKQYDRAEDVVVVLSHLGYAGPQGDRDGRITGPDLAEVGTIAFIADSHTHSAIEPRTLGTVVYANGGRYLENFIEITLAEDGGRRMELKSYDDVSEHFPDSHIEDWLNNREQLQGLSEILFHLPMALDDTDLRTDNIPLGRFLCRLMNTIAGTDFAFHNIGGIRSGLPGGPVTARDLFNVLPFGDDLVVARLQGRQIMEIFNRGSGHGGRGFPQFYGPTVFAWRDDGGKLQCGACWTKTESPWKWGRPTRCP